MFLDALLLVSDAQALTATALSTNTIDLSLTAPIRRIGDGEPVGFGMIIDVGADFTTGDETYAFQVIQSATANLASATILSARSIVPTASPATSLLAAGKSYFFGVPPGTPTQQFIGLNYVLGGTTPTITVTSWLTLQSMMDKLQTYAKGYVGPA